jgi:uncharacterized protein
VVGLLDVNVLVALLVPEHEHHAAAMEWFTTAAHQGWATCGVTELGVIRVCAQLPGGPWGPEATADRLLLLTAASRAYEFWPDALSPAAMPEVRSAHTGKQITDRYLLSPPQSPGVRSGSLRAAGRVRRGACDGALQCLFLDSVGICSRGTGYGAVRASVDGKRGVRPDRLWVARAGAPAEIHLRLGD